MTPSVRFVVAPLLAGFGVANAQPMLEVEAFGQVLTYTRSGTVEGCGIRAVGVVTPTPGQARFKSFDVSANVWKSGVAVVKLIGEETPVNAARDPAAGVRLRLHDGWLRADGGEPLAAQSGQFKESSSDKLAYLFPVDMESAFRFIVAVGGGTRFQLGVRWLAESEWIYFATLKLKDSEREQLSSCIRDMLK